MAGRHARKADGSTPRRRPVVVAALGLILVLGAGGAWALASRPTPTTTTAAAAVGSASQVAATAAGPSTSPEVLSTCARSVEAGERVVTTAVTAHDHWGGHVQAQLDYDAGKIDREQLLATFAATKATGAEDVAAFDAAAARFRPVSTACAELQPAALPAQWQETAAQCARRAAELGNAVLAAEAVVGDWRAHVEMMRNKDHTDPTGYGRMWDDMVAAAPSNLSGFAAARSALDQQQPCSVTGD